MTDLDAILTPIPGDNPAGEDLRYTPVYDEIKEARRADDPLDRGEWDREIKTSDWDKVISVAEKALVEKTKDLQIAAWLTEALTKKEGFEGLATGLEIMIGFLNQFWDYVYPEIEDDDLDFRAGPIEFLNKNLWLSIKEIPITDRTKTPGYSWLKWEESRQVGYDKDILNQYGDVDEGKKAKRDDMIADGKLSADEFDSAVAASNKAFYMGLSEIIAVCQERFRAFDEIVDEKFGKEAPRLSEFRKSLEDCEILISRILKEKRKLEPDPEPETTSEPDPEAHPEGPEGEEDGESAPVAHAEVSTPAGDTGISSFSDIRVVPAEVAESDSLEQTLWKAALRSLETSGVKEALTMLLNASCTAASVRQQNRYRLLIAKLCLQAGRPDLARPVVEQLHALIEELNLEQWESPMWIAEVLDAYYQCLTVEGASDDDYYKANNELFQKLCTKDITKAMIYKKS